MSATLRRNGIIAALIVTVAGVVAWAYAPAVIIVESALATRGEFTRVVEEDGKTRVRDRYVISAPGNGRLLRMPWKAGDSVEPGAVIATILPTPTALLDARTGRELREQLGRAEALLAHAIAETRRTEAIQQEKKMDLERARKLLADNFVSQADYDRARLGFEAAQKALEAVREQRHAAEHELEQAKAALSFSDRGRRGEYQLLAPSASKVLRVIQESEAVVRSGEPLIELADPAHIEVVVELLTDEAQLVAPGAAVTLERPGLSALIGTVRRVEPAARTKVSALGIEEQRVNVVIDITSPPDQWRTLGDGFKLSAQVEVERRSNALTVPAGAVFNHDSGSAVFVIGANGRAHLKPVKAGPSNRARAVIESGLNEGEAVIVYPSDAIAEGVRVRVQ